ncbi:MAG: methionine--tRNA ligase [bacterium]
MSETFYITTPIYYVNSHPHIGHAYTTIVTDVFVRYRKLFGEETYFLTGTDEHGQKIAESAQAANLKPQEFVDRMTAEFRDMWPHLHIQQDQFIRTTDAFHKSAVQAVLQKIYDQGEIYLKDYEGLYCVGCERFLDQEELTEEGNCPDHQKPPQVRQEKNYFFRMSAYQEWLIGLLEENKDLVQPARYRNELLSFLKAPLQDLCISRPKSRLEWGIDLPFDNDFVTYVWFDALLNYVTALGWPEDSRYEQFWKHCHHVIGKDILKTHGIYWPCMLKAAGFPVFKKLAVHGHWVVQGSKMSKSLGNVVNPLEMKDLIGVDGLRYFLLREMSYGEDANFTEDLVFARYHGELSNNFGNLLNRSISMSRKNFENEVPPRGEPGKQEIELYQMFEQETSQIKAWVQQFEPHRALERIAMMSSAVNKYLDENKPWKLAKEEDQNERLGTVLYTALDASAWLVCLLEPVMPEKMKAARIQLGLGESPMTLEMLKPGLVQSGTPLPLPEPLFPRIQLKQKESEKPGPTPKAKPQSEEKQEAELENLVGIESFQKLDFRTGRILESKKVKGSDKLLVSQVDLGESKPRSIVSGVAEFYRPEDLPGMNVVVVSNLKPVKLRGELSEGMILATDDGNSLKIVEAPGDSKPGTVVR